MLDHLRFCEISTRSVRGQLNGKELGSVLPAINELAIIHELSKMEGTNAYPNLVGSDKKPEAFSSTLFSGLDTYIEVKSVSNGHLNGAAAMKAVCRGVGEVSNNIVADSARHLKFFFHEKSESMRRRRLARAPIDMVANQNQNRLEKWLFSEDKKDGITLQDADNSCTISWKEIGSDWLDFWSTLPSEAGDVEENPIYRALTEAATQINTENVAHNRCVIVVDAGSYVLSEPNRLNPQQNTWGNKTPATGPYSARQIANHFIQKTGRVDVIIFLYVKYESTSLFGIGKQNLVWNFSLVDRLDKPELSTVGVTKFVNSLPKPRLMPASARQIIESGKFCSKKRSIHFKIPTSWKMEFRKEIFTMKLSRNLLVSLITGELTQDEFQAKCGLDNIKKFKEMIAKGYSVRDLKFENSGLADDDDAFEFVLKPDAALSDFKSTPKPK